MIDWAVIEVFHGINRFLGSSGGELLKRSVELLVLLLVTYMTASEYTRSKNTQMKLLMYAFGVLTLGRLIMSVVYAYVVFVDFPIYFVEQYIPVLDQLLEVIGLILLTYAFLYPAFIGKENEFGKHIKYLVTVAALYAFAAEAAWLWLLEHHAASIFANSFFAFLFQLSKVAILWYALPYFIFMKSTFGKYRFSVALAFILYSITPLIRMINLLNYNGNNLSLTVLAHPFPIIAVLFFTRVTYLKLADKAYLEHALLVEKKKVEHEKELSKMKDDFVSMVSHELRTPLTSMKLYVSLLMEQKHGKLSPKQKKTLDIIQKENNRLSALVTTILDLAKLEQKKISLTPKRINLYDILFENEYENIAKDKKIRVIHSFSKQFTVTVDPERFRQIFINLFSNAVKFTKEKGSIELSAKKVKDGFEFSVADEGPGIPHEDIPKLFTKFYQADGTETRKIGGTGLGLVIAKELASLHSGTIKVHSIPKKGSVFTVFIPQPLPSQQAQ